MGDSPTTTNEAATIANQVLNVLIFDVAVQAARAAIIAAAPVMANPVLDFIDDEVLKFVAGKIFDVLATGATFAIIDAQTSLEASAANTAADNLKKALGGTDQNAIDQAKADFTSSFGRLVHWDGSAPHT